MLEVSIVIENAVSVLLARNGERFSATEATSSSDDHIYIDREEVEGLEFFASNFGAEPRIGVRFDERDWAFFEPDELPVTEGGNYRVKVRTAIANGEDVLELAGDSTQARLSDLEISA